MGDLPETWKFATLREDGSIKIEWEIRQPFRSMGVLRLTEKDDAYVQVFTEIRNHQPGRRVSLGASSMDQIADQLKEEEDSPQYQELLKRDAALIEDLKKQYPNLSKKPGLPDEEAV